MRKQVFFALVTCGTLFAGTNAMAENCELSTSPVGQPGQTNNEFGATSTDGCNAYSVKYYNYVSTNVSPGSNLYYQVTSCNVCKLGYASRTHDTSMPDNDTGSRCNYSYTTCDPCSSFSSYVVYDENTCIPTATDWGNANSSHIRTRTRGTRVSGCCALNYEYTCDDGYYGQPTTASSGCSACPGVSNTFYTDSNLQNVAYPTSDYGHNPYQDYCYYTPGTYYNQNGKITIDPVCVYNGARVIFDASVAPSQIYQNGSNTGYAYFSWNSTNKINITTYCLSGTARPATKPTSSDSGGTYCWCTTDYSDRSYTIEEYYSNCSSVCTQKCVNKIRDSADFRAKLFQ